MRTMNAAPILKANQVAAATLLCFRTLGGSVALSFFQIWIPTNAIRRIKEVAKSAIIVALFQANFVPPH